MQHEVIPFPTLYIVGLTLAWQVHTIIMFSCNAGFTLYQLCSALHNIVTYDFSTLSLLRLSIWNRFNFIRSLNYCFPAIFCFRMCSYWFFNDAYMLVLFCLLGNTSLSRIRRPVELLVFDVLRSMELQNCVCERTSVFCNFNSAPQSLRCTS